MLVVHPASCCDVCLDPYSISLDPANSPHAIACGHIFCLTCLRSLSPSACPLCRKVFQPDRIKKLHIANPPELDNVEQDAINARANLFLQRIAVVSGEDTPELDVIEVLTEVQEWLQSQPDDDHMALRASIAALRRYKALQDQSERARVEQRRLRHQLRNSKQNADLDSKTSRAVEDSLHSRIQQIEIEHAQELQYLNSELESLRNSKPRHRNTANPLPPPPEPLPLDRFPAFARPGGPPQGPDPLLGGAVPYPAPPPRENTTNVNGDAHSSASNELFIPVSQTSKPQPASHSRTPEPPRMEEWWVSAHVADTTRRPQISSMHSRATEHQQTSNRGVHTVPGAVHSVRTISRAPSPRWATRPITEDRRSDDERELIRKGRNTAQINVTSINADVANTVSTRLNSAAAFISGYGSGYESGYQLVSASNTYTSSANGNNNGRVFPLQEIQTPEQVTDGFGLIDTHSRAGTTMGDHLTPVARERNPPRRAVTGVTNAIRSGRISRSLSDIPLLDTPVNNGVTHRVPAQSVGLVFGIDTNGAGPSRLNGNPVIVSSYLGSSAAGGLSNEIEIQMPRPQPVIPVLDPPADTDSLRSETTWGTLTSRREGSMDHLGLVGLHNGGVRGQGSVAGESVLGRLSSDEDTTDGEDVGTDEITPVIPTAEPADISMLGLILEDGGDYPLLNGELSRFRTPYATQSSHPTGVSRSSTRHASRAERSTHRRRHTSQPRAYEQEGTTRVPSPATYNNTNALSLHFDASLSMHDHTASAISAPFANGPEIIAPTPVVGRPNIVHTWANRS